MQHYAETCARGGLPGIRAEQIGIAAIGKQPSSHDSDRGRLARTVGAEQRGDLTRPDAEGDVVKGKRGAHALAHGVQTGNGGEIEWHDFVSSGLPRIMTCADAQRQ